MIVKQVYPNKSEDWQRSKVKATNRSLLTFADEFYKTHTDTESTSIDDAFAWAELTQAVLESQEYISGYLEIMISAAYSEQSSWYKAQKSVNQGILQTN